VREREYTPVEGFLIIIALLAVLCAITIGVVYVGGFIAHEIAIAADAGWDSR